MTTPNQFAADFVLFSSQFERLSYSYWIDLIVNKFDEPTFLCIANDLDSIILNAKNNGHKTGWEFFCHYLGMWHRFALEGDRTKEEVFTKTMEFVMQMIADHTP